MFVHCFVVNDELFMCDFVIVFRIYSDAFDIITCIVIAGGRLGYSGYSFGFYCFLYGWSVSYCKRLLLGVIWPLVFLFPF